ncbi:uncharacterized protein LOC143461223 isoform X1 [Clavelina lepadiformis]|uniref:uncharacterized protein LOC143461223 isoform X1 n=1 Tax=Clavelina lepadiformis TaxID=159417 RepID=UPI0040425A70
MNSESLYNLGRKKLAWAMFKRLIHEDSIFCSTKLFYQFVSDETWPKPIKLDVLKFFIRILDGCICSKDVPIDHWEIPQHAYHLCNDWYKKLMLRAHVLLRNCTHILMITYTDKTFSPWQVIEQSAHDQLSSRTCDLLVEYAVEGFFLSNKIWQEDVSVKMSKQCQRGYRYAVPQFENWRSGAVSIQVCKTNPDGLNMNTKNNIITHSRQDKLDLDLRQHNGNQLSLGQTVSVLDRELQRIQARNKSRKSPASEDNEDVKIAPSIKVEVVAFGSPYFDLFWALMRKSSSHGFTVNTASISLESLSLPVTKSILQNLENPTEILKLNFSHHDPASMLKLKDLLSRITELEQFTFASWTSKITTLTFSETYELWNDVFAKWPHLKHITLSRIRMSFGPANAAGYKVNNPARLPKNLLSLNFSNGCVTTDLLEWLSACSQGNCQLWPITYLLPQMTFSFETCLSRNSDVWKKFLSLIHKPFMAMEKLSFKHCGLVDDQAQDLVDLIHSQKHCSPLNTFVINEPKLTWRFIKRLLLAFLSGFPNKDLTKTATLKRRFPKLQLFSVVLPALATSDASNFMLHQLRTDVTEYVEKNTNDKFTFQVRLDTE